MALEAQSRPRLAKKARLVWDKIEQRHVLLSPERGLALNAVAAAVVRALGCGMTVTEISRSVAAEFSGADTLEVGSDVLDFLHELELRGLLEEDAP
jgi:coenzyme PQQ biosynthesis protein PqqD